MTSTATATFTLPEIITALNEGFGMAAAETSLKIKEPRFALPMAAALAHLDGPEVAAAPADFAFTYAIVQAHAEARAEAEDEIDNSDADGRTWTGDQVAEAVNWAVDWAAGARSPGACADDLDNFTVNAVLTLLHDPEATFETVVSKCYGEDPDEVSGWLRDAA
jgi:hypothetical protein